MQTEKYSKFDKSAKRTVWQRSPRQPRNRDRLGPARAGAICALGDSVEAGFGHVSDREGDDVAEPAGLKRSDDEGRGWKRVRYGGDVYSLIREWDVIRH
jgi:hypothetical protein